MSRVKRLGCFIVFALVCILFDGAYRETAMAAAPSVEYQAHIENEGWKSYQENGETAGSTGKSLSLQALKVRLKGVSGGITYQAHLSNIGWSSWVSDDRQVGTVGQNRPMEAIRIKLTGTAAQQYDVYYRVHCDSYGWLGWACNGENAGTSGGSIRMEAIQVKLVRKGTSVSKGSSAYLELNGNSGYAKPVNYAGAKWSAGKESGCQHDIQGVPAGTPVYAIADGTITCQQKYAYKNGVKYLVSYGNVIYFTSSDGKTKATYAHLNGFSKCNAQIPASCTWQKSASAVTTYTLGLGSYTVRRGDLIGYVGTTGNSTGPHLHFELRINGSRVNPPSYVSIN